MLDASSMTDPYYRNQLEKFRLLHDIMMKYYYAGNRLVAMPDPVMRDVELIAGGCHGYAAQKARSIMRTLYDREIANDFVCNHYATLTFKNGTELRHRSAYTYTIHPNPVKDQLEITGYDASVVSGTVSIYDVLGTAVIHQTLNQHTTMIDVSALPSGTYIYKITDGKKLIQTDKFIKLK